MAAQLSVERAGSLIIWIRGQRVLLDYDLAPLYQVEVKQLKRQVRRNSTRFPSDFMFELTKAELDALRSQSGTSKASRGGRRYPPLAFTEQGVAMLSGVLKSARAIEVNVALMRAFVRLRQLLAANQELARKVEELERRMGMHDGLLAEHSAQIREAFEEIRAMMEPPESPRRKIGFVP
jgi:hypothetical protein